MLFLVTPIRTRGKNLWEIRGIKAGIKKKMIEEERAEIEARSKEADARYQSMDNDRWNILGLVFRNPRRKSNVPTYTLIVG